MIDNAVVVQPRRGTAYIRSKPDKIKENNFGNYSARLIRPNTSDLLTAPSAPSFLRRRESKQGFDDKNHLHSRAGYRPLEYLYIMEIVCFVDFFFCGNDD